MHQDDNNKVGQQGSRILLHPTCDQRGWVTQVLNAGWSRADGSSINMNPESVFFAWLLDLPAGVAPELAASTLLTLARQSGLPHLSGADGSAAVAALAPSAPAGASAQCRERVASMLQDLVNRAEQEALRPKHLLRHV